MPAAPPPSPPPAPEHAGNRDSVAAPAAAAARTARCYDHGYDTAFFKGTWSSISALLKKKQTVERFHGLSLLDYFILKLVTKTLNAI